MLYECEHCKKTYKSYQSRWNHIFKNHQEKQVEKTTLQKKEVEKNTVLNQQNNTSNTICKFCNKELCDASYRRKHEKICKIKKQQDDNILKNQILENQELKKQFDELKQLVNDQQQNKQTTNNINQQVNVDGNINNNINNNIVNNNITIIPLGSENLDDVLSKGVFRMTL